MSQDLSYEQWMAAVNRVIISWSGGMIGVDDLSDFMSRDLYDSGASPKEGAEEALLNDDLAAMFFDFN